MIPGPPPVITAKPAFAQHARGAARELVRRVLLAVRAEPKIETAGPIAPKARNPLSSSCRTRSIRWASDWVVRTACSSAFSSSSSWVAGGRGGTPSWFIEEPDISLPNRTCATDEGWPRIGASGHGRPERAWGNFARHGRRTGRAPSGLALGLAAPSACVAHWAWWCCLPLCPPAPPQPGRRLPGCNRRLPTRASGACPHSRGPRSGEPRCTSFSCPRTQTSARSSRGRAEGPSRPPTPTRRSIHRWPAESTSGESGLSRHMTAPEPGLPRAA